MTTINLEKSLISQNRKLAIPEELLIIGEYEKYAEHVNNDALERIGLNTVIKKGRGIKSSKNVKYQQTKIFSQDRVFHVSQIEAICKKYRLRFLPAKLYKGTIDSDLPKRIEVFEVANRVRCSQHNTRIVAPAASFRLQKRPKDPLFFYEINDEYFYLVHKWGNDLSILRAMFPVIQSPAFCYLFILSCILAISGVISIFDSLIPKIFFGLLSCAWTLIFFVSKAVEGEFFTLLKPDEWNSEIE